MTIEEALRLGAETLQACSDTPRLDSECLLMQSLAVQRSHLYAWPQQALSELQQSQFNHFLAKRLTGQPIAYIRGWQEFWSERFVVGPGVLIPRPETELLVEQALALSSKHLTDSELTVLDLGTGSGCIALALAKERPNWRITAVDQSTVALDYAQKNLDQLAVSNVELLQSRWFANLSGRRFDIIVSNPPYVAADDAHLIQGDVRFEPPSALASGQDGLDDIGLIIEHAARFLTPAGTLLLEHGFDQAAPVAALLADQQYGGIQQIRDLQQHIRVTLAHRPD